MKTKDRTRYIATLDPIVRMKLAHLATYGIEKARNDLADWEYLLRDLTADHDDGKENDTSGEAQR
ncbi:TPA: hypothetical protein OQU49_004324 [Shigella flexneri]|nr:hypothetical protein [Shigella flexneri]